MDGQLNIQEMIDSGVLELYVAGALPEGEAQAIHKAVQQHPALLAEVTAIEGAFVAAASAASKGLKFDTAENFIATLATDEAPAKVLPLTTSGNRRAPWWAIAAAIALLISLIANVLLYQQSQGMQRKLLAMQANERVIIADKASLETRFDASSALIAHFNDSRGQTIALNSTIDDKPYAAKVKWNPATGSYALFQWELEALSEDQVYQLWAIIDGQPVSAGLLGDLAAGPSLQQLTGSPQAFAITIEPAGGSEAPTLTQMVVVGNVAG